MKKFNCFFLVTIFLIIIFNFSFAVDTGKIFNEFASPPSGDISTATITSKILGVLTYIGFACAIILTLYTGIGFLTATPATKAKLKERLWLIVIGVIMLAGTVPLVNLISNILYNYGQEL